MDVQHRPPHDRPDAAGAGSPRRASPGLGAAPPRLPSISSLLNVVQGAAGNSAPTLPGCESFDNPVRSASLSNSLSPTSISPTNPGSSEFPTVATASPAAAEQAGAQLSERERPTAIPSHPPSQITSVEFPDGNALRPLPSGLSSSAGGNGRPGPPSSSNPLDRPRSNSISYSIALDYPSLGRSSQAHQGFATSSERGGSAEERARPSFFETAEPPSFRALDFESSPARPRALSISTADEYRTHPSWPGSTRTSPLDPHFPRLSGNGFSGRRESDLMGLRKGSAGALGASRLAFVAEQNSPPIGSVDPLASAPPLPPPYHWGGAHHPPPPSQQQYAMLPPPAPPSVHQLSPSHHPSLVPLTIPSGLALSSPVSPPNGMNGHPPPHGQPIFPPIQPRAPPLVGLPFQPIPVQAGWGALPGHPGPPPSGQIASDLAYGVEQPQDVAGEAGRYICPHCAKRFARPSSLRIHMHSHTGEKPFTCPLCERAFSVQSNLRRHLKIHKGGQAQVGPSRRGDRLAKEQQARAAAAEAAQAAVVAAGAEASGIALPSVSNGGSGEEGEGEGAGEGEEGTISDGG
ncbi:hypothetical protein JCM8547_001776 [Rhodosporidiobolus lusitaniae]